MEVSGIQPGQSPWGEVLGPCRVQAREVAFGPQRAVKKKEKLLSGMRPHHRLRPHCFNKACATGELSGGPEGRHHKQVTGFLMYTVGVVPELQSRSDSNIQSGTPRTPSDRSKSKSLCENQPTVPGPRDCHRKKIPTQKSLGERTRERSGEGRGWGDKREKGHHEDWE